MNIEQELCKAIAAVFQSVLPDVEVKGNWIEEDVKGVDVYEGRKLVVNVGARKYDAYTSLVAEFAVTIDGYFAFSEDTTLSDTVDVYEKIMTVLDGWHADIASVKRDLTIPQPSTSVPHHRPPRQRPGASPSDLDRRREEDDGKRTRTGHHAVPVKRRDA